MTKVIGIKAVCSICEYEVIVKDVSTDQSDHIVVFIQPCKGCMKKAQEQAVGQVESLLDEVVYFEDGTGGLVR